MNETVRIATYICPNCRAVVDEHAGQCESCGANFSTAGSWKPWKDGHEPETEPSTFFLCCFVVGLGLLILLAYMTLSAVWSGSRGGDILAAMFVRAVLRFPIVELVLSMTAGLIFSFVVLQKAQLPESRWPTAIFGWATFFFGLVLAAMGPIRFLTAWLAPYPLVPCVLLYIVGFSIAFGRLKQRRANAV